MATYGTKVARCVRHFLLMITLLSSVLVSCSTTKKRLERADILRESVMWVRGGSSVIGTARLIDSIFSSSYKANESHVTTLCLHTNDSSAEQQALKLKEVRVRTLSTNYTIKDSLDVRDSSSSQLTGVVELERNNADYVSGWAQSLVRSLLLFLGALLLLMVLVKIITKH